MSKVSHHPGKPSAARPAALSQLVAAMAGVTLAVALLHPAGASAGRVNRRLAQKYSLINPMRGRF
ncbi:MAG: hypothetical protein V3S71_01370, partial [Acidobacteriota bacterium]